MSVQSTQPLEVRVRRSSDDVFWLSDRWCAAEKLNLGSWLFSHHEHLIDGNCSEISFGALVMVLSPSWHIQQAALLPFPLCPSALSLLSLASPTLCPWSSCVTKRHQNHRHVSSNKDVTTWQNSLMLWRLRATVTLSQLDKVQISPHVDRGHGELPFPRQLLWRLLRFWSQPWPLQHGLCRSLGFPRVRWAVSDYWGSVLLPSMLLMPLPGGEWESPRSDTVAPGPN